MNPSKSYFCTWENFPTWENSSLDLRNCLSDQKWVGSLMSTMVQNFWPRTSLVCVTLVVPPHFVTWACMKVIHWKPWVLCGISGSRCSSLSETAHEEYFSFCNISAKDKNGIHVPVNSVFCNRIWVFLKNIISCLNFSNEFRHFVHTTVLNLSDMNKYHIDQLGMLLQ